MRAHTHSLTHTHTQSLSLSPTHTHTHTHTDSLEHTHTHTHTHTYTDYHTHTLNQRRREITRQRYSSVKEGTWQSKRLYGKPISVSSLSIFSTYGVALERFPCHKIGSQIGNDYLLQNNTIMKYLYEARNFSMRIEFCAQFKFEI